MQKLSYTFALFLAASIIFSSCRNNDDDIPPGSATTDPGVLIGSIDGNPIRWATRNVAAPGRFAQNATDAGMLFQWNRRTGWSATDPMVSSPAGATWDSTITGETWVRTNDPCPSGWRVPTVEELRELHNARGEWQMRSGVYGRVFGSGDNTLFLPAAGWRNTNGVLTHVGFLGWYWSSSTGGDASNGRFLYFAPVDDLGGVLATNSRSRAFSVRCVSE